MKNHISHKELAEPKAKVRRVRLMQEMQANGSSIYLLIFFLSPIILLTQK